MKRKIDIESIIEVANALGELNQKSVFVGGSVVSLYIDDPAADELRLTMLKGKLLTIINSLK